MTSKEALIRLYIMADTPEQAIGLGECYDVVERDLEVLEILREHFRGTEQGLWYIDLQESDFDYKYECTEEEWNNSPQKKIKEWLYETNKR